MTYPKKECVNAGFTLIEVIVYLALFGILFVGAIAGAYSLMETAGKNQARVMMQEEGGFLLAKINRAVSNAKNAEISGDQKTITITPWGGASNSTIGPDAGPGKNIVYSGDNGPITLNNSSVVVSGLEFRPKFVSGEMRGIEYSFNLTVNSPDGLPVTASFNSISYFRK